MTANSPLFTVIYSAYNQKEFIRNSLPTILTQTDPDFELIVVDDASTDGSAEEMAKILKEYGANPRLEFHEKNMGGSVTLNQLIPQVKGKYLFLTAADDWVSTEFIAKVRSILKVEPEVAIISAVSRWMDRHGQDKGLFMMPILSTKNEILKPKDVADRLALHTGWFINSMVVYRRKDLIENGIFDLELGSFADGYVAMVMALKGGCAHLADQLGTCRRMAIAYSSRSRLDARSYEKVLERARYLMANRDKGLFPSAYIQAWEKLQYFISLSAMILRFGAEMNTMKEALQFLLRNHRFSLLLATTIIDLLVVTTTLVLQLLGACLGLSMPALRGYLSYWRYRLFYRP